MPGEEPSRGAREQTDREALAQEAAELARRYREVTRRPAHEVALVFRLAAAKLDQPGVSQVRAPAPRRS